MDRGGTGRSGRCPRRGHRTMSKRKQWIVTLQCAVQKDLVVEGIDEASAWKDPYEGDVIDESETDQLDWKVVAVRENE